ncbi:hypothetical protein [Neptunomonas antarctica]|uniref:Short C-terminal domain-containing protein n=1 Tax=Neptunomonas antarctica TaxID=619304 RepID=A0A1N7N6M6_9GAMM|nr:hypothetical protein [Neptunomonas antarctica]SIS93819.1 hypothetical protein SAMN05421760_10881 [Neptunomonas antarctica]
MKYISIIFIIFIISGCSTHMTSVAYEGNGFSTNESEPLINSVIVSDERGTDSNWLGAIRGGYGNRIKTLRTEESTDIVVEKMFRDALDKSNLLSSSTKSPYKIKVIITKFDCSYYFNREAHAYVNVSLIDSSTSNVYFSKVYKTDEVEAGVGAGIFGSVDTLRNLAETAMNKTIDKTLSDEGFINALENSHKDRTTERLNKIDSLYKNKMISKEEYIEKRSAILSAI